MAVLVFHGAYALDRARHFALRLEGGFLAYGYVSRDVDVPAVRRDRELPWLRNVSYAVREHQMYSLDFGPEVTAVSGRVRPYGFATAGTLVFPSAR